MIKQLQFTPDGYREYDLRAKKSFLTFGFTFVFLVFNFSFCFSQQTYWNEWINYSQKYYKISLEIGRASCRERV